MPAVESIRQIIYQPIKLAAQQVVSDELLQSRMRPEVFYDHLNRQIVHRFRMEILARDLDSVTFPTTWKDALRERFSPRFLLRRALQQKLPAWLFDLMVPNYTTITARALYLDMLPHERGSSYIMAMQSPMRALARVH